MNTTQPINEDLIPLFKSGSFVDDRGKHLIGKYMMGGAAVGGSAALATSLMNYLSMLKDQGDAARDTSADDDVLYLTLNKKQQLPAKPNSRIRQPGKRASIGGGVALTGGALATLGSYALVRNLYQKYKKKQLQGELDSVQNQFLDVVSNEGKSAAMQPAPVAPAGKPMGMSELLTSTPVTLTLLAALASGALAHKALDKTFPVPKRNKPIGPKRIVLRRQKEDYYDQQDELNPDGTPKTASYDSVPALDQYDDGLEFLIHTALADSKKASVSELRTILGAAANGRREEFANNMLEHGYDTAMDLIKGAEVHYPTDRASQILTVSKCVKTAELNPVLGVLAAAEYEDMAPHFMKASGSLSKENKEILVKMAGVLGAFGRNQVLSACDIYISKSSAMMPEMAAPAPGPGRQGTADPKILAILEQLIAKMNHGQVGGGMTAGEDDPDVNLMTTDSESSSGSEEGTHTERQDMKPKISDQTNRGSHKANSPMEVPIEDDIDKALVGGGKSLS